MTVTRFVTQHALTTPKMVYISPPNLVEPGGLSYESAYYNILAAHRSSPSTAVSSVAILVAPDVDSLCAARILVALLRQDDVMYQLRPVSGVSSLLQVKDELAANNEVCFEPNQFGCDSC